MLFSSTLKDNNAFHFTSLVYIQAIIVGIIGAKNLLINFPGFPNSLNVMCKSMHQGKVRKADVTVSINSVHFISNLFMGYNQKYPLNYK